MIKILINFNKSIDTLRKLKITLQSEKAEVIEKSYDFSSFRDSYNKDDQYLSVLNLGETVEKSLKQKLQKSKENFIKDITSFNNRQIKLKNQIKSILKKSNSSSILYSYEDFIPEKKYKELVITLTKAHQQGVLKNKSILLNLKKFRPIEVEENIVYVKDNRTQYGDMILINDKNEILFLIRNKNDDFEPGKYCLPGGHIEDNESYLDGALRECFEETGIKVEPKGAIYCGEYLDNKVRIHYYSSRVSNDNIIILDEREQIQYEWVPIDKIGEKPLIVNLHNVLQNFIKIPVDLLNKQHYSADNIFFDTITNTPNLLPYSLIDLVKSYKNNDILIDEFEVEIKNSPYECANYFIVKDNKIIPFIHINNDILIKGHKYIKKESDGKGGWRYFYKETDKSDKANDEFKRLKIAEEYSKSQESRYNEIKDKIVDNLKKEGIPILNIGKSATTFGKSWYIKLDSKYYEVNPIQIRISDHSVGDRRFLNDNTIAYINKDISDKDLEDKIKNIVREFKNIEDKAKLISEKRTDEHNNYKERENRLNEVWEDNKNNYSGYRFKNVNRTYQDLDVFKQKHPEAKDIFIKKLSGDAYSYEWAEKENSGYGKIKPSLEYIESILEKSSFYDNIQTIKNESDTIEKGKKASVGEIRTWSGVKMQKTTEGKWLPVKEGSEKTPEQEDSSDSKKKEVPENKSTKELEEFAKKASDEGLKNALDNSSETIVDIAKKELETRGVEIKDTKPNPFGNVNDINQLKFYLDAPNEDIKRQAQERIDEISLKSESGKIKVRPEIERLKNKFSGIRTIFNDFELNDKFNDNDPNKLGIEEQVVLRGYTGNDYWDLNQSIRNPPPTEEADLYKKEIDDALDKLPNYEGIVHRGINLPTEQVPSFLEEIKNQLEKEGSIKFLTQISTSADKWVADDTYANGGKWNLSISFEINSKTGKDVQSYSEFPEEKEVLFKSSTRYSLKDIKKNEDGTYLIKLDEI